MYMVLNTVYILRFNIFELKMGKTNMLVSPFQFQTSSFSEI